MSVNLWNIFFLLSTNLICEFSINFFFFIFNINFFLVMIIITIIIIIIIIIITIVFNTYFDLRTVKNILKKENYIRTKRKFV